MTQSLRLNVMGRISIAKPNYNVAPGQLIRAVLPDEYLEFNAAMTTVIWGIESDKLIANARAESIDSDYWGEWKRCLIPVDGFFQWSLCGQKIPRYITLKRGGVMYLAGVYKLALRERGWSNVAVVVTWEGRGRRMPLIVGEEYLAGSMEGRAEELVEYEVSRYVNSVRNNSERCIEAV